MRFQKTALLNLGDLIDDDALEDRLEDKQVEAIIIELQPDDEAHIEAVFKKAKALRENLSFNSHNLVAVKVPNENYLKGKDIANAMSSGVRAMY